MDEVKRIERGISAFKVIVREREDGVWYLQWLRRERDGRMDDQA